VFFPQDLQRWQNSDTSIPLKKVSFQFRETVPCFFFFLFIPHLDRLEGNFFESHTQPIAFHLERCLSCCSKHKTNNYSPLTLNTNFVDFSEDKMLGFSLSFCRLTTTKPLATFPHSFGGIDDKTIR
jgi:hypothetical protein